MRFSTFFYIIFGLSSACYVKAQDSIVTYRVTSLHASISHFMIVSPHFPQVPHFFPAAMASIKTYHSDSAAKPEEKVHFMITTGAAASQFKLTDGTYFVNILDKSALPVFSRRFFGGFGMNYRAPIAKKLILDVDVAPIVQIIWDKSEETRFDTSGWESRGYENIYQGLHLFTNVKLEYRTKSNFGFYISLAGSIPLINKFARGEDNYGNPFKGQLMAGAGLVYFYRTRHKFEKESAIKPKNADVHE